MKKWLVGLLAAGLCAASAWAANYTLVTSMEGFGAGNYVITGEKTDGGEAAMLNVVAEGNFIQTADVTVVDGVISDPDASIVWTVEEDEVGDGWTIYNEGAGGYVNYPGGKNNAATESEVTDDSTWAISLDGGVFTVDNVGTPGRKLQYNKSSPRFACYTTAQTPLKFYKEGDGAFSVEVEPSIDFRLEAAEWALTEGNQGAYLAAVAKNGVGDISYEWTGSFEGTDEILRIPDGLVAGIDGPVSYSVTVTATDSSDPESRRATAEFSFTLVRAPALYTVAVADGIENGWVEIWQEDAQLELPAEVYEGTTLKVVATPADRSFKVESVGVAATDDSSMTVSLENDEFVMPAFDVTVTAAFAPWEGTVFALVESMDDFEAGADYLIVAHKDGEYTSALKNEYQSESDGRIAVEEVEINADTVVTEDDSIVWTIAAGTAEGTYTLFNATAGVYVSAPAMESANAALLVTNDTADAVRWTIAIETNSQATIGSIYEGKSLQRNNNSNNKYFANYKGGAKPFLFKKVGAGVFSVVLDKEDGFEIALGNTDSITATAKNSVGEVAYVWTGDLQGEGATLAIPDTLEAGEYEVTVTATDSADGPQTASADISFKVVAPAAKYQVGIDTEIPNGSVAADRDEAKAGELVTLSAEPAGGFKLETFLLDGEPIPGNSFEMPAKDVLVSATFAESGTVATYTVVDKTTVETTGVVPEGSEATFVCNGNSATQLTGGTGMTLTLKGYEGATITGLTLSMKSNARAGAGSLSVTCGDAVLAEITDAQFKDPSWNGAYTQEYVDIAVPVAATVINGNVVITIAASVNSIYCQSFTIEYEPAAPVFSVGFDKEDGFTVDAGTASSITASAQNGEGDITYAWSSETPELNGTDAVLEIPGTLEPGAYSVTVTATDSSDEPQSVTAGISFEVVAPPADYTVTIAGGIENGTVAISVGGEAVETPATLAEGTAVTVVATPSDGYALEAILVNDASLEGDTFTVAGNTVVSATFTEIVDYATLPFLAEDTPFTGKWKNSKQPGVTSEGLDNDYGDGAAKLIASNTWVQIKFQGTPGELVYTLKGNGTSEACVFEVRESATGADDDWTPLATFTGENALPTAKATFTNELSSEARFVRFVYVTKAAGNVALYDVYISAGGFSVNVDKNGFELEQGQGTTVTAEAKNGVEPYAYVWSSEIPELGGSGPELAIPDSLEPGEYAVTVTATDSSTEPQTATADVTFTVVEAKPTFTVSIADGIENGEVSISVGGEAVETPAVLSEGAKVTVVATPAAGFKVETITVNGEALTGDTFTVTANAEVSATFAPRGDEFVKITSLDALEEGEYVITGAKAAGEEYAMLAELSDGSTVFIKRQETPVEIENDAIAGPDDSIVWHLEKVADGWTIKNAAIGFVGYVESGNSAGAEEEASAKSTWIVSASDELFLLQNFNNTGRYLLYNVSSPRFACYTSPTSGKALAFYKKAGPAVFTVSVDKTGFEVALGNADTVTASAKNGAEPYGYAWSSVTPELNGSGAVLEIPDTLPEGEYAATVTVTDSSSDPQTATADVTFTVVAPAVKFAVTVDQAIPNGSIEADKTEAEAGETVTLSAFPEDGYKLVAFIVNGEAIGGNTFPMPEGDALVTAEFAETESWMFVQVSSASDFEVGGEYLLVAVKAETYTDAMKNAASGTRIGVDAVTIAEDGFITTDNADIVWQIKAGAAEGQYVLFNEAGGVYAAGPSSAGNGAQLVTDGEAALAQWELDFTALPSLKIKSVSYDDRWLQRNKDKGNPYFATYNTEQATPLLFKKARFAVSLDKEEGFTVEEGTADAITATALRGVEPYGFVWSGDLAGEGETLAIPADLAQGAYAVTVTATDSSEPPQTATKSISFEVVAPVVRYAITVAEGIENGEVSVDKDLAEAGETVTVTATPAAGYELVSISVNGTPIEGNTFTVEGDSVVSATFSAILDYATLPFVSQDTPYSGPWQNPEVVGLTSSSLGSDYKDGSAKFDGSGAWMQIKFQGTPGNLSYGIKGNGVVETSNSVFAVYESADGENWTAVAVYETGEKTVEGSVTLANSKLTETYPLSEDSRFVKFFYETKGAGNVGIYDVYIGVPGGTEPTVTVSGETTVRVGDTFQLALTLENYAGGEFTWEKDVAFGYIYDGAFWWTAEEIGSWEVTFSAMDGTRTIASESVTLTIQGVPALVFGGDDSGTVGSPVNFTVVAENVADPTVTFMGFLALPEGSALTDEAVALDFPNVTFTPDVAGDYGLAFCAGTEGVDHVEELHIVSVAAAPAEPAVTLVDGETTAQLGNYFLLQFALENYTGEFAWTADVGEIDEDGYFTWTPVDTGDFPVVVAAVTGDETIASATVTLTVTSGGEPGGEMEIQELSVDSAGGTLSFKEPSGSYTVESTKDLVNGPWETITVTVEDGRVIVPMEDGPRYYRVAQ